MNEERIKEIIIKTIEKDTNLKDYIKKRCRQYINKIDNSKEDLMYNNQAKTIIKLQEQNRLLNFDVIESNKEKTILRDRIKKVRKTIIKIKEDLETIKRNETYNDLGKVISILRDIKTGD